MRNFSLEERGIFKYFDPDKAPKDSEGNILNDGMILADPFEIDSRWSLAKISKNRTSDIDIDFNNINQEAPGFDPEGDQPDPLEAIKMQSLRNLLPFIHEVFNTKPMAIDGTGITFEEAFENLNLWGNFSGNLKKNTDDPLSPPISSPEPMEKSPNGKNSLDSISTKIASSPLARIP